MTPVASPETSSGEASDEQFATTPLLSAFASPAAAPPSAPPAQGRPPKAQGRFTPGTPAELRSRDDRVVVSFPANGFERPLTLDHRTLPEQRPLLRARGKQEPPAHAGLHRGLGTFFLEATDDQGRSIHKFAAPLTISVRFTQAQLRVLNISPQALTLY